MCFLNLFISSTRKNPQHKDENSPLYVTCFQGKILTFFFSLNITISYHLVSSINLAESSTEVSNEELKQQLREALEVGNSTQGAALQIFISFQCSKRILACSETWMDPGS